MKLKKGKNKLGFTLTELLASIIVLAIICSITIYTAVNVIKSSKEKSYEVTKNEIKSNTNQYLLENNDRLVFLPINTDNSEYQCITVQNLIDYGYLDNNVVNSNISEKEKVKKTDYIYIEKSMSDKAVVKIVYPVSEEKNASDRCDLIVKGLGNITISSNPSIDSWSKFKNITIIYSLKNINDVNSTYNYIYSYTGENSLTKNEEKLKTINVTSNGTLTASILYEKDSNPFEQKIEEITKVDNDKPVISLVNDNSKKTTVKKSTTIPIKVTDESSGVDLASFTKEDIVVKIGNVNITDFTLTNKNNGTYDLKINDLKNAGKVTITIEANKVLDKVIDDVKNGNDKTILNPNIEFDNTYIVKYNSNGGKGCGNNICRNPIDSGFGISSIPSSGECNNTKIVTYDKAYGNLCIPTKDGYTFQGWYTDATNGKEIDKDTKVTKAADHTIYAHWKEKPKQSSGGSDGGCCRGIVTCVNCGDDSLFK